MVRDLVCCTSCPICSIVSCWATLNCSACASTAAWPSKTPTSFSTASPCHTASPHSHPSDALAWLSCCSCCWGGEEAGGLSSPMTCSNPKNFIYTNLAQPRRVKKDKYQSLPQSPHRAKNDICAGYYRKGTVLKKCALHAKHDLKTLSLLICRQDDCQHQGYPMGE